MKVAILANRADSFVLPMAQGLERMFARIGVQSEVLYHGLRMLEPSIASKARARILRGLAYPYFARLWASDVIVIVGHLPTALMSAVRVEMMRRLVPRKPVVLYDLVYLPTRPWVLEWLREGRPEAGISKGGHHGLNRYDWYLCVSVVSRCPMLGGCQPYSLIGIDLDDGSLYPETKKEFIALVDFERPQHMAERAVQIQALEEADTNYIVLHGRYSREEIRKIYRKCSIYFVSASESFGLPICELQACGSYVFTPYAFWCQSHWIKEDLTASGPGRLSPNFVVYDNDKDRLVAEIKRLKDSYDPNTVVETFKRYHPQLYYGDPDQLRRFVDLVDRGEIHSRSHEGYPSLEDLYGSGLDT